MRCPNCGTENPVNTIYCTVCGHQMNLSPEEVQAATMKELDLERAIKLEGLCRTILGITIALFVVVWKISDRNQHLPDPDLEPMVSIPYLSKMQAPVIEADTAVLPIPNMQRSPYREPDSTAIRKAESRLRKAVYSIDNVILVRKANKSPLRGRILREEGGFLYMVDPQTLAKYQIPRSEILEIRQAE